MTKARTHNSTSPGFPLPMRLSKLPGLRSTTLEAPALRRTMARNEKESNMVVGEQFDLSWRKPQV